MFSTTVCAREIERAPVLCLYLDASIVTIWPPGFRY